MRLRIVKRELPVLRFTTQLPYNIRSMHFYKASIIIKLPYCVTDNH